MKSFIGSILFIAHRCFNKDYDSHPLREPSPQRGILIMIDGTPHDRFQNRRKSSLHLAIDNATGKALCGWFMPTECLEGYVHMLEILVTKYGLIWFSNKICCNTIIIATYLLYIIVFQKTYTVINILL